MRGEHTKEIQINLKTKSRKVGKTDKDKKGERNEDKWQESVQERERGIE